MWYFVAGRLMSLLTIALMLKLSHNFLDLGVYERFIGWFFVEHVFEDYSLTAGKFFLVSEDFRTLIKNLLIIIRNFIFLAQVFTPLEFLFVNSFLLIVVVFYKSTLPKGFKKALVFLCCVFLLQSFLVVDLLLTFFIVNLLWSIGAVISVVYFYITLLYSYTFLYEKSFLKNNKIKLLGAKILIYIVFILTTSLSVLLLLINTFKIPENFINEFSVICLVPYSYLYYI
jgi:hypothetical protein